MTNVDNDMDIFTQALSSVIDRNCDRDIANGIVAIHGFALARAEAAEALAYERLESALFAEQRATDLEARVAELESQLAAQQWRPIDEPAPEGVIEVKMRCAVADDGGVYKIRTDIFVGWWTSADDSEWRPLPPAPQEPTQ